MKTPLRVLIVEDRDDDAELVLLELRRGGFEPDAVRVETAEAMGSALEQPWDIVISDWSMPCFDAMAAFAMLRDKGLDLPFIIVSGTIGEETAVRAMKAGVQDFLTKGHLSRLIPAIERELREFEIRQQSRKMREHLVISERMASVGTLAAGVAHEVNNPLATVIGNAEFVSETLARMAEKVLGQGGKTTGESCACQNFLDWTSAQLAEARDSVAMMQEAAEQMRLVVHDLRVFSHPGDEVHQGTADLRTVLESSLRMASTEIRHRARLVRQYEDVSPVDGSESRLGQIFLNLIVNAAQAIPEGRVAQNEIGIVLRMEGTEKVVVEIRDTGSGIPPDILPRIFNPFFTTKPSGIGTGLGLAICHRLITALGGEISVQSELGKGTVFQVALRAARHRIPRDETIVPHLQAGSRASILVVDDDPALRRTFHRMLQKNYDVSSVGTAREVLHLVAGGARFDLILCDLMMPEMTGMDLHAELARTVPDQAGKMAFVTGGAFTDGARTFLEGVHNAIIEKPFTLARIQEFIQSLLH